MGGPGLMSNRREGGLEGGAGGGGASNVRDGGLGTGAGATTGGAGELHAPTPTSATTAHDV